MRIKAMDEQVVSPRYRLTNIRFCGNENTSLMKNLIYAELRNAENGELHIAATLEYILTEVRSRDLDVEGLKWTGNERGTYAHFEVAH